MRRYMIEFLQLFAPHISARQLDDLRKAGTQEAVNELFQEKELPLRGGCSDNAIAAA